MVIHRILQRIVVSIFSLPLQCSRSTLIYASRRRLSNHSEDCRIKAGRLDIWIDLDLQLWQQGNARGQNRYGQHFRRDVARQISDAHVIELWCTPTRTTSAQHRAPLNESGLWAGDLRTLRVSIVDAPIAPGRVRAFAISTSRLQFNRPGATPPDSSPRGH